MERPLAKHVQGVWSLTKGQHGYRAGAGEEIAVQIIHERLQKRPTRRLIGMDLSGAFDRTLVAIIKDEIAKLPMTWQWKRLATVFAENSTRLIIGEESFWTDNGVPQGGVFSPTLWDLFIDTLIRQLNTEKTILADRQALQPRI